MPEAVSTPRGMWYTDPQGRRFWVGDDDPPLQARQRDGSLLALLAAPTATSMPPAATAGMLPPDTRPEPVSRPDASRWLRDQVVRPAATWVGQTIGSLFGALDAPPSRTYPTGAPYTSPLRMLSSANAVLPAAAGVVVDAATGRRPSLPVVDPMQPAEAQATFAGEAARRDLPSVVQFGGTLADLLVGPEHGLQVVAAMAPVLSGGAKLAQLAKGARATKTAGKAVETADDLARLAAHGQSFDAVIGTKLLHGQQLGLPKSELLPSDYVHVGRMMEQYPHLADDLPYLHAMEVSSMSRFSPAQQAEVLLLRNDATPVSVLQAAAKGGEVKRGWYNESRAAVDHLYREDADRFTKVVAALSPRTSVESDALNSVTFFENWREAGRPTSEKDIQRLLNESVQQGDGKGKGVLQSWRNNTTTAVQDPDEYLSGPKVQAFSQNLSSKVLMTPWGPMAPGDAYTADAWAAGAHQFEQELLGGREQQLRKATPEVLQFGDADTTAAYLRATADARRAGEGMAQITGTGLPWTGSEVQETKWSYFKNLYELSDELKMPAVDVVRQGLLTNERIAGTPDFTTLATGPYGEQLRRDPAKLERMATVKPGAFGTATQTDPAVAQLQLQVAQVVDDLRRRRRMTSDWHAGRNEWAADRVIATSPQEVAPARRARLPQLTPQQQSRVHQASLDALGRNTIATALFDPADVLPAAPGTGVYGRERNPLLATGVGLPVTETGALDPAAVQNMQMAARLSGGLTMQDAVAWNASAFDPGRPQTVLHAAVPSRLTTKELEGVLRKFPNRGANAPYALVDRGNSFEVLRVDGGTVTPAEQETLLRYLERAGVVKKGKRNKAGERLAPAVTTAANVAPPDAYTVMGADQPTGSRAVTTTMLGAGGVNYDALTAAQQQRLDSPRVRSLAGTLLQEYEDAARKGGKPLRADFKNMLRLVRDGGFSRLRDALDDPSQLLPVLALLGVPGGLAASDDTRE